MAAQKKAASLERRVTICIPMGGIGQEAHTYVCLNGKAFTIPHGMAVEVPLGVAEIVEQKLRGEKYATAAIRRLNGTDVRLH